MRIALASAVCLLCLLGGSALGEETSAFDAWMAMFQQAAALRDAGDLPRALDAFEAAEQFALEKRLDPNCVKASIAGRIDCYLSVYDYVGLRDVSLHMLEVARRTEPIEDVFDTLLDLGNFETMLGNPPKALVYLEEASTLVGDDPAKAADVHLRVANAQLTRGQLVHALESAELAAAYFEDAAERSKRVSALSILALVHRRLGELDLARECAERALELADEKEDGVLRADLITTLGNLELSAGRLHSAREAFARARALYERHNERMAAANAAYLQAVVLGREGRLEEALAGYEEALARAGPTTPVSRSMAARIAWTLERLGRHDEARKHGGACLKAAVETGDLPVLANVATLLAVDHLRRGEDEQACKRLETSLDALFELAQGLSPVTRARALAERSVALDRVKRVAFGLADSRSSFALLDRARATTITSGIGRSFAAPPQQDEELERARERVAAALSRHRQAEKRGLRDQVGEAERAYRKARDTYREALRRAQRRDGTLRLRGGGESLALEAVQALLRPQDAMVLYAFLDDRLVAFVVEKEASRRVQLATSGELDPVLAEARAAMDGAGELPARAGLAALLVDDLDLSEGIERLIVSPDGSLAAVPFAWIADDMQVIFTPSATAYGLLQQERPIRGKGVLAMADPVYGGPTQGRRRSHLGPLEHAREEAEAISREEDRKSRTDLVLLGRDATESALRSTLPTRERWHALHFACHGLLDEKEPSWSSLALTSTDEEDGLLTVIEVMGMRMPTDLAVLSACETGLGKSLVGEGMLGLASAFLYAGAPRVVASQWRVDDEATTAFMKAFYEAWNPKPPETPKGAAEALEMARQAMQGSERWSHPHYWAGWVLWGLPD